MKTARRRHVEDLALHDVKETIDTLQRCRPHFDEGAHESDVESADTDETPAFVCSPHVDGCESPPEAALSIKVIAVLAALCVAYFAKPVLMPIVIAILVSLTMRPLVRRLQKAGLPRPLSGALLLGGIVALGALGVTSVVTPAQEWAEAAPEHLQKIQEKLATLRPHWSWISNASEKLKEITNASGADSPVPVELHQSPLVEQVSLAASTGNVLSNCVLVLVLVFFILTSGDQLLNEALAGLPRMSEKKRTVKLVREVERGIAAYLFTVTAINAGLGCVAALGFWLLGVPSPILWGAMAFIFNYVPFFGPMACSVVVICVSLLSFDSLAYACVPPLFFVTLAACEGNLLTPFILGRSMSINPVIIFLALVIGGWAWGLGGAILAVPLLAVTRIATEKLQVGHPLARMLAG